MELYCLKCKNWSYAGMSHQCGIGRLVLIDKEMVRIVSSLWDLGIEPLTAMWSVTVGTGINEYLIRISVDLEKHLEVGVLGKLPTGWEYYRETSTPDKMPIFMIGYVEKYFWFGFEAVEDRVKQVIKEFEKFLRERDAEAVKALMLLTSC